MREQLKEQGYDKEEEYFKRKEREEMEKYRQKLREKKAEQEKED